MDSFCQHSRPSDEQNAYVRASGITEELCWFRNFVPHLDYVKYTALSLICVIYFWYNLNHNY